MAKTKKGRQQPSRLTTPIPPHISGLALLISLIARKIRYLATIVFAIAGFWERSQSNMKGGK